jgi:hypothetical protein
MTCRLLLASGLMLASLSAQDRPSEPPPGGWPLAAAPENGGYVIVPGTRIPLTLLKSISTKHTAEGEQIYLTTLFPILAGGRIVIPVGSYVNGTVTHLTRPGRVRGKGELYLRFDTLILPNGVTREFRSRMGGVDGDVDGKLNDAEGKVTGEGNKLGDAKTVGEVAAAGAGIGGLVGAHASNRTLLGTGLGAGAGTVAGLAAILLTRGPDTVLPRGTTVEMVLDRSLSFSDADLRSNQAAPRPPAPPVEPAGESPSGTPATVKTRRFPY